MQRGENKKTELVQKLIGLEKKPAEFGVKKLDSEWMFLSVDSVMTQHQEDVDNKPTDKKKEEDQFEELNLSLDSWRNIEKIENQYTQQTTDKLNTAFVVSDDDKNIDKSSISDSVMKDMIEYIIDPLEY